MLTALGDRFNVIEGGGPRGHHDHCRDGAMASRFEQRRTVSLGCTLGELASAINGTLLRGDPARTIGPVATDSRYVHPGDTFWALRGEHFDGSDFLGDAVEKGAEVLVTSSPEKVPDGWAMVSLVRVADAHQAFLDLASWYRERVGLRTVCITGSCGKTSTKELVSSIFKGCFEIICTYKNFNNLIGVPITILNATRKHELAVLELGMNMPGEIGRLTRVARPDIALVTNVCPAHLEGLGSVQDVAQEKLSLFRSLSGDEIAVVNLDDRHIFSAVDSIACKKVGFSLEGHSHPGVDRFLRLVSWRPLGLGIDFEVEISGVREPFFCGIPGLGNLQNLMAAIAVSVAAGIPLDVIRSAISTVECMPGRLCFRRIGNWMVIDDTYNANPASMKNALSTLAFWSDALFRCAILGDMFELGPMAPEFHREVGQFAASSGLSLLIAVGRYAHNTKEGAVQLGMSSDKIMTFDDTAALCVWLKCHARDMFPYNAWILIKGSRGMKMERAIEALMG